MNDAGANDMGRGYQFPPKSRGRLPALVIGALLALLAAVLIFWSSGSRGPSAAEQAIDQSTRVLVSGWEDSRESDGANQSNPDTRPRLGPIDAGAVLRLEAMLRELIKEGDHADLLEQPAIKELLRQARHGDTPPELGTNETVFEQVKIEALPREQRDKLGESVGCRAEAQIVDVAVRFSMAAADHALERIVRAEVELGALLSTIRTISSAPETLPQDCLALAPTEHLQAAQTALRSLRRRLADAVTLAKASKQEEMLRIIDSFSERLERVIPSGEHQSFRSAGLKDLKKIPKDRWLEAMTGHEAKVARDFERRQAELWSITGWQELHFGSHSIRGPPAGSLEALVETALREFDLDPRTWSKAQSRLAALGDELAGFPQVPEILRQNPNGSLPRVLSLLDDETLWRCEHLAREVVARQVESPANVLFPDRGEHFKHFASAIEAERQRRKTGGQRVDERTSPEVWAFTRAQLTSQKLTERAQIRLLGLIQERFPRPDLIPSGLRDELRSIYAQKLDRYQGRIAAAAKVYQQVSDYLALATGAVPAESLRKHAESRVTLEAILREHEAIILEARKMGVDVASHQKALLVLTAMFPRGPPDAEPPAPNAPKPRPPQPPSSSPESSELLVNSQDVQRFTHLPGLSSPKLEKHLFFLEAYLADATTSLELTRDGTQSLNREPQLIAKEKGRRTLDEAKLTGPDGEPKWKDIPPEDESRLPESLANWKGRFKTDPAGKTVIFDYRNEVKDPRSFEAVGGGIHFGEIAQGLGRFDTSGYALKYSKDKGLYFFDGRTGKVFVIDPTIHAQALKALYRFVVAGRNAAISIGWALERESFYQQQFNEVRNSGSPVLLDPYFTDTPVGQDLILADSLPWRFNEEKLPNGKPIPFHEQFAKELDAFRKARQELMLPLVEHASAFKAEERKAWLDRLEKAKAPVMLLALIREDSVEKAKAWFIARSIVDDLNKEAVAASVIDARSSLNRFLEQRALTKAGISGREALTPEGQRYLDGQIKQRVAEIEKEIGSDFDKLVPAGGKAGKDSRGALRFITDIVMTQKFIKGSCPRAFVDLWIALTLPIAQQEKPGRDEIARALVARFSATTLAMLYDDAATITFGEDAVKLSVGMKYRYATSALTIGEQFVAIGKPDDASREVETIAALSELANKQLPGLIPAYPPLRRVAHYAEVAALLRWAVGARERGELAGIDLSELGAVAAHDTMNFPTADAVKRK